MVSAMSAAIKTLAFKVVKLVGLTSQTVEIEPGTVMHFWVPKETEQKNPTQIGNKKPNKAAVVLAHPFAGYGILMWFFQVLALASQYSVYVPDFLFFGGSTTSRPDRSPGFQAQCLARGLRKLGVEKCTVVGLSYGGIVGFKMAAMYPELVEALVVSSTVIELKQSISSESLTKIGVSRWSELLLPESVEGVKTLFTVGSHKWPWLPDFVYKDFLEELFGNRKRKAELLEAMVVTDEDSTNVTKYPQRVHFLWGLHDKIFTSDLVHSMKEQLGDKATIQWIKDAGHIAHIERPLAYNNHLKEILASIYDSP